MDYKIIIIFVFLLTSLFLLGKGITGFVISQSCCFGGGCDPEYLCSVAKESPKSVDYNSSLALAGSVILIFSAILLYKKYH